MIPIKARRHYRRPIRWLPYEDASENILEFAPGMVEFKFKERKVIFYDDSTISSIASLDTVTNARFVRSYSGRIIGDNFEMMVCPKGAFSKPVIEIRLLEGDKPEAEWVKQKIEIKPEYSFPGGTYCRYSRTEDGLDSLDVTFDPKFEDLARVVSIVLLSYMEDLFSLMKG